MSNPYLDEAEAIGFARPIWTFDQRPLTAEEQRILANRQQRGLDNALTLTMREQLVMQYAWAIPNDKALDILAQYSPLIEIGAGLGYWASLLRARGVDILAYDIASYRSKEKGTRFFERQESWTEVLRGGPEQVARHPERTIFLCWPPFKSSMASQCLAYYTGSTVLYVGEDDGCTGDEAFREQLYSDFACTRRIRIPQWFGMHDELMIWTRK